MNGFTHTFPPSKISTFLFQSCSLSLKSLCDEVIPASDDSFLNLMINIIIISIANEA